VSALGHFGGAAGAALFM